MVWLADVLTEEMARHDLPSGSWGVEGGWLAVSSWATPSERLAAAGHQLEVPFRAVVDVAQSS